jgi:hypothetical protein
METKTLFNSAGGGGMTLRGRAATKGKHGSHKSKHGRSPKADLRLEQPVADSSGTVPCQICGHGVDPKRMHFHMVRFHGAAFRSKGSQG